MQKKCNSANAFDYLPNEKYSMELIRQNPYHVIGILAGANQRTIAKRKAEINAFQRVGKSIEFDTDLEFTGNPDRSNGALEKAFADIEINQNKLFNALFWFANHNHLDETALTYLQSGDLEKAEEIWQKITSEKEVSAKNFTSFNNLSTLKLAVAFKNGSIDTENLKEGVRLKTVLLTSNNFNDFCHLVADETYTVDQDKELEMFVNALLEEVNKVKNTEAKKIPAQIGSIHPKIKSLVSEKLTDTPLHNIERKTEKTKKLRSDHPEDGLQLARNLYRDTKSDLTTLSELLSKSDLKYKMVADKLAKELLQCGIDYFKEYQDREEEHESGGIPQEHSQYAGNSASSDDLGTSVMKLFKIAKSIATGTQIKERISENINGLQEWVDNAEKRRINSQINENVEFIVGQLKLAVETLNNKGRYPKGYDDPYSELPESHQPHNKVRNEIDRLQDDLDKLKADSLYGLTRDEFNINLFRLSRDIVKKCKPKLALIRNVVGKQHEIYVKLSNDLASISMACLIEYVNNDGNSTLGMPSKVGEHEINIMKAIGLLDMKSDMRQRYNEQKRSLLNLKRVSERRNSTRTSNNSGGCYIATMAYGSYEHSQVIELRKFRDDILSKSIAGRSFINVYYWLSPKLVKILRGRPLINSIIRKILNQLIKQIK